MRTVRVRLKEAMAEQGVSVQEFSDRTRRSRALIQLIISGEATPYVSDLGWMSEGLGVEPGALLEWADLPGNASAPLPNR